MALSATGKLHANRSGSLVYLNKELTDDPRMPFKAGDNVKLTIVENELHIKKISK